MRVRGRKPTYEERKIIEKAKYDTYSWLVTKNTSTFLELVHRETGEVKVLNKSA